MTVLVDIVIWFLGVLPLGLSVRIGCFLGWVLRSVLRVRRRVIERQLRLAFPERDDAELARLLCGVYRHLGLILIEFLRLITMPEHQLTSLFSVRGLEHLEQAQAKGKGVLILSAHIGSWELGLARAALLGIETHVVVKPVKGRLGAYAAQRLRNAQRIVPIPRRNSIRQILKALRDGHGVGFVLDQNMTSDEGVFVDFFGQSACTMTGLAVISQRCGAPVIPVRFYREDDLRRHVVEFLPEIGWEARHGELNADIVLNTQRYTTVLENMIRERPEQWIWLHKRWKTQPEAAVPGAQDSPPNEARSD